jgi:hypothetical protein
MHPLPEGSRRAANGGYANGGAAGALVECSALRAASGHLYFLEALRIAGFLRFPQLEIAIFAGYISCQHDRHEGRAARRVLDDLV